MIGPFEDVHTCEYDLDCAFSRITRLIINHLYSCDSCRFQREEVKIQAWENHQRAKIEAEMKSIEAKMERKRAREHDRLARKLASARSRAEAKREAAEARRSQEAERTDEQAAQIRKTGHIPSSISCWCWCL
uniref:Remorin C-terminal domain-containing protein n=1 Tax=Aegilops tauschii subsp. strangulata TaxID=200361 RepID=A0A453J6G2_AEGTS